MKVAVVTPVGPAFELAHLRRCHDSVRQQAHPARHILVFDGCDCAPFVGDCDLIQLPPPASGDIGSCARMVGTFAAFARGFDLVAWLDADNWLHPVHVQQLVRHHHDTGQPVVASGRFITDLSGEECEACPEMAPGCEFIDTNCMAVTNSHEGRAVASIWGRLHTKTHHLIGDRYVSAMAAKVGMSCHYKPTVFYRSCHEFHYAHFGWDRPPGVKLKNIGKAIAAETAKQ